MRYLQSSKLINKYKENANFNFSIRKIMSLAYVPITEIDGVYESLSLISDLDVQIFLSYFNANFMSEKATRLSKGPAFWSVHQRILLKISTTTNSCEAYHRHLNKNAEKSSQPLENCINLFKKEEQRIKRKIGNLMAGCSVKKSNNIMLYNIVSNYQYYTFDEFFEAIADFCNPVVNLT